MALTDENGSMNTTMLVSPAGNFGGQPYPVYMGGNQGGGTGFGNDNGWWVILLILLIAIGGWGNNGNQAGNGGGFFGGGMPYVINADSNGGGSVQRGFDQAAIMAGIGTIQGGVQGLSTQLCGCCSDMQNTVNNGFANVQQSLCNGFAGVNATINGGFANAETAANARQMANMQQAFAGQMAMSQGFNALGSQFADCCCENRLANCQTQNIIQSEASATRFADANNTRDIIQSQSNGTQAILDKLCQLELDGKNDRIADLERQLTMANLNASQVAQTAQIRAGQIDSVSALVNELRSCPIPSQPVYGSQPIFTCPNNNNNGCGCGNFA